MQWYSSALSRFMSRGFTLRSGPTLFTPHAATAGKPTFKELTPQQIADIRRMRTEDPQKYTSRVLANMFNVPKLQIARIASIPKWRKDQILIEQRRTRKEQRKIEKQAKNARIKQWYDKMKERSVNAWLAKRQRLIEQKQKWKTQPKELLTPKQIQKAEKKNPHRVNLRSKFRKERHNKKK